MNLNGKYAVVTGGGAGIGLAITMALHKAGVRVLVVGRAGSSLERARAQGFAVLAADLSNRVDRERVVSEIQNGAEAIDIFVNNAGTMTYFDLRSPDAMQKMEYELALDLHAPIHFSTALLPHLLNRPEAAIVNLTSGLVYAPSAGTPGYSAAKNGLHAFNQSLRWQTRKSQLQVLEVLPPTVDTDMNKHYNGPKIKPKVIGDGVRKALENGTHELRVGQAKALFLMSRIAPAGAFNMINTAMDKNAGR